MILFILTIPVIYLMKGPKQLYHKLLGEIKQNVKCLKHFTDTEHTIKIS